METNCVVCQYVKDKLVHGMLPVVRAGELDEIETPDLCLDLRDNCPHTIQFIQSITVPPGVRIRIAKVGYREWSTITGPAVVPTIAGSRYTVMF